MSTPSCMLCKFSVVPRDAATIPDLYARCIRRKKHQRMSYAAACMADIPYCKQERLAGMGFDVLMGVCGERGRFFEPRT